MEGSSSIDKNEACEVLLADADRVCGAAAATTSNDALSPACRDATARALTCLRCVCPTGLPSPRAVRWRCLGLYGGD
jgi:hypothetical protein